jgi:hypothetical protein
VQSPIYADAHGSRRQSDLPITRPRIGRSPRALPTGVPLAQASIYFSLGDLARAGHGAVQHWSDVAKRLAEELGRLQAYAASLDVGNLERQLAVDPLDLIPALFGSNAAVEQMRAVLSRVFPKIVLSDRPQKFVSVWTVTTCGGRSWRACPGRFR